MHSEHAIARLRRVIILEMVEPSPAGHTEVAQAIDTYIHDSETPSYNTTPRDEALVAASTLLEACLKAIEQALGRSRSISSQRVARCADGPLVTAALESDTLTERLNNFLEPIRSRPDGGWVLLETLRAYIDAEFNSSSAASALNIRRQTVGSRIRLAEQLLGRPLRSCIAELDVALRLAELASDGSASS